MFHVVPSAIPISWCVYVVRTVVWKGGKTDFTKLYTKLNFSIERKALCFNILKTFEKFDGQR